MQMHHIPLQKGGRITAFPKFISSPLIAHPHAFLFYILWDSNIWNTQEIDSFLYLYYHFTSTFFPPFIVLWDPPSLEHPLGDFLYSQKSVTRADSQNIVKIHYMTNFSPYNIFNPVTGVTKIT